MRSMRTTCAGHLLRVTLSCFISTVLAGCYSFKDPPRLYTVEEERAAIRHQTGLPEFSYGAADFAGYLSMSEANRVKYRNDIITARMYSIDITYSAYEASLTRERQGVNFGSAVATIGLTSAATLVPSVATKNILAAIAGGITGANAAYNEDVLLNKTIQILQVQMRANRSRSAARLLTGMGLSTAAYPLGTALSDLEDYYRAGTMTSALVEVTTTVGMEAADAKAAKDRIFISYGVPADAEAQLLRACSAKHRDYLNDLIKNQLKINYRLPTIINSPELAASRRQLWAAARQKCQS